MSIYFIGIDISKYKHDCCIISAADQKVVSKVTIKNNKSGFDELLTIINSLSNPEDIRIGFESTAHYALNLELFLENSLLTFMEVNPVLISEYKKSTVDKLRKNHVIPVDQHESFPGISLTVGINQFFICNAHIKPSRMK